MMKVLDNHFFYKHLLNYVLAIYFAEVSRKEL